VSVFVGLAAGAVFSHVVTRAVICKRLWLCFFDFEPLPHGEGT
jgi:hypothetical protein